MTAPKGSPRATAGAAAKGSARPRGREEVVEAILQAARQLIAERGPSGVSLREIASEAGVNFGLLYQYVGTKEDLLNEVNRRAANHAASRFLEVEHLDEALHVLMTLGDGTTGRVLGWAALEGQDPSELFGASPALAVLAELMRRDAAEAGHDIAAEDAQVFSAIAMVIALGWRLFGSLALTSAGLDATNPERYDQTVKHYVELLGRLATAGEAPERRRGTVRSRRRRP